jgi:hypothetical protein
MTVPSEKLMSKIMDKLQQEKILTANEAEKIGMKILSGRIKSEDWRLAVDLSVDKVKGNVEKNCS